MSTYGTISTRAEQGVLLIELISEDGLNCYTPEMGEDLCEAISEGADDPDIVSIILTGRGTRYCAGAHKSTLNGAIGPSGYTIGTEPFIRSFPSTFANLSKLTIAAFNGPAVGIGATMSLLCDLRISVPEATLRFNFGALGIMPGLGSTSILPSLIGLPQAKKLLLLDHEISAEYAFRIGLIDDIVSGDKLIDRALELATAAHKCRGQTLTQIKRCLNAATPNDLPATLAREALAASELRRDGR